MGYYVIVSEKSDPVGVVKLLAMHGIAAPGFVETEDFINPVVRRCHEFFVDSTLSIKTAIADAHDPRVSFVASGFADENAVFVPGTSLLFGLDAELNPQDEVVAERHAQCDIAHRDPLQVLEREICYRASAGHPNPAGAVTFSNQILTAIP